MQVTLRGTDVETLPSGLTHRIFPQPRIGSLDVSRFPLVTYTPNPGVNGSDSFAYTIADGNGGEDTAVVNVAVQEASSAGFALRFDGFNDFPFSLSG